MSVRAELVAQDGRDVLALAKQSDHVELVCALEVAPEQGRLCHPPGQQPWYSQQLPERWRARARYAPMPEDQSKRRKNRAHQVLVVMAVELLQPKGLGRIGLRRIDNDSAEQVVPFVQASIEAGAQVRTDGSAAYRN
jgi:hypothetical protein